jgi:hypothetical protein
MTSKEQEKMVRVSRVIESYAANGLSVAVQEIDNWGSAMSTQIAAMKRRGTLGPHYTYRVTHLNTGRVEEVN